MKPHWSSSQAAITDWRSGPVEGAAYVAQPRPVPVGCTFDHLDTNNDGVITREEWNNAPLLYSNNNSDNNHPISEHWNPATVQPSHAGSTYTPRNWMPQTAMPTDEWPDPLPSNASPQSVTRVVTDIVLETELLLTDLAIEFWQRAGICPPQCNPLTRIWAVCTKGLRRLHATADTQVDVKRQQQAWLWATVRSCQVSPLYCAAVFSRYAVRHPNPSSPARSVLALTCVQRQRV